MLHSQDGVTRRSNSSWCLAPIFWTFGIARRVCKREWMIGGRSELGYHSLHVEWPTPQKHGGKWRVWWINWITLGMNEKKAIQAINESWSEWRSRHLLKHRDFDGVASDGNVRKSLCRPAMSTCKQFKTGVFKGWVMGMAQDFDFPK